jgi:hypothetical protein
LGARCGSPAFTDEERVQPCRVPTSAGCTCTDTVDNIL